MKNYLLFVFLLINIFLLSCSGHKSTADMLSGYEDCRVYEYKDSCKHLALSVLLQLPVGDDAATLQIRDSLIADFCKNIRIAEQNSLENEKLEPYDGEKDDMQAFVNHYGKNAYDILLSQAMSDYDARMKYIAEDTTMTDAEKESIAKDVPMWEFDLNTKKITDTLGIVVYYSDIYLYYGGAHGGLTGTGAMTYDKSTGNMIKRFIEPDSVLAMQHIIRKGLIDYYLECRDTITESQLHERLLIDGKTIPLPQHSEYPNASADSLILTYGQYEIASYADGMPSFKVALKDVMRYLTTEAKELLKR